MDKLNWINFNEDDFEKYIIDNNLSGSEFIFKEINHMNEIRHHIGRATINLQNSVIAVVGGRFIFDYKEGALKSFAHIDHIL